MNKNSEFIDVEWFDTGATGLPGQTIGVVLIYNEHAGFKAYMGIGFGNSQEDDMKRIYEMGQKIDYKLAKVIWGARMKAEWMTRHLADANQTTYKYDDKTYLSSKKLQTLRDIAKMSQGEIRQYVKDQALARELDPLFHALKQAKAKRNTQEANDA
jgi:hypothetical protein